MKNEKRIKKPEEPKERKNIISKTKHSSSKANLSAPQFALFDLDKDQRIDYHEFKVALKALGFDLPKPEIISLLTTHGTPPDTHPSRPTAGAPQQQPVPPGRLLLTLPSFQTIAANLISARDPRDEILRAFALFDTDGKGMISLEDLRRVARELGEGLEEEELVAMIEEFDLEGKGGVGRAEFVQICLG
jgi:centrin-3